MEEIKLEAVAQIVGLVGVVGGLLIIVIQLLFKLLTVRLDNIISKIKLRNSIEMKDLEFELKSKTIQPFNHPFWTALYNYLNNDLPYKTAQNDFKTKCAKAFIEATWLNYEEIMKNEVIRHPDLITMNSGELYELIMKGYKKLTTKRNATLKDRGMNAKIIEVFERKRREEVNMILNLYQDVVHSKIYINNVQKLWAILDLQKYFLEQMAESTWNDIITANGELRDMIYDGDTNVIEDHEH